MNQPEGALLPPRTHSESHRRNRVSEPEKIPRARTVAPPRTASAPLTEKDVAQLMWGLSGDGVGGEGVGEDDAMLSENAREGLRRIVQTLRARAIGESGEEGGNRIPHLAYVVEAALHHERTRCTLAALCCPCYMAVDTNRRAWIVSIVESTWWAVITILLTSFSLLAQDALTLLGLEGDTRSSAELAVEIVLGMGFIMLLLDLVLVSSTSRRYVYGFFWWMDLLATVSLLFESELVWSAVEGVSGWSLSSAVQDRSQNGSLVSGALEVVRSGRKVVRLVKIFRVFESLNAPSIRLTSMLASWWTECCLRVRCAGEEELRDVQEKRMLEKLRTQKEALREWEHRRGASSKGAKTGGRRWLPVSAPAANRGGGSFGSVVGKRISNRIQIRATVVALLLSLALVAINVAKDIDPRAGAASLQVRVETGLDGVLAVLEGNGTSKMVTKLARVHAQSWRDEGADTIWARAVTADGRTVWRVGGDEEEDSATNNEERLKVVRDVGSGSVASVGIVLNVRTRIRAVALFSFVQTNILLFLLGLQALLLQRDVHVLLIRPISKLSSYLRPIYDDAVRLLQAQKWGRAGAAAALAVHAEEELSTQLMLAAVQSMRGALDATHRARFTRRSIVHTIQRKTRAHGSLASALRTYRPILSLLRDLEAKQKAEESKGDSPDSDRNTPASPLSRTRSKHNRRTTEDDIAAAAAALFAARRYRGAVANVPRTSQSNSIKEEPEEEDRKDSDEEDEDEDLRAPVTSVAEDADFDEVLRRARTLPHSDTAQNQVLQQASSSSHPHQKKRKAPPTPILTPASPPQAANPFQTSGIDALDLDADQYDTQPPNQHNRALPTSLSASDHHFDEFDDRQNNPSVQGSHMNPSHEDDDDVRSVTTSTHHPTSLAADRPRRRAPSDSHDSPTSPFSPPLYTSTSAITHRPPQVVRTTTAPLRPERRIRKSDNQPPTLSRKFTATRPASRVVPVPNFTVDDKHEFAPII